MTKIEEVARAICAAEGFKWEDQSDPMRSATGGDDTEHYFHVARAAIEAMLEPTEEMLDAAATCDRGQPRRRSVRSILLAEHHAMISAALRDSTG